MGSDDEARGSVFRDSKAPEDLPPVRGYDFDDEFSFDGFMKAFGTTGFQATNIGAAIDIITKMKTENKNTKIYFGYTSNMVSSGVRDTIRFLAKHRMVDVIVTTAGGIEEDIIKCLADTLVGGSFAMDGHGLRRSGLNRIGNLVIPNRNYCLFEDFMTPLLDTMLEEQRTGGARWTPSKVVARLGKEIDNEDSICYWANKNSIPVYCPALTDGSIGDILHFHSIKNPGFVLDILEDLNSINRSAKYAERTGMIILGGGVVKHHICNANLMRNGADYAVYINTGIEADGSDSGASPDEAVSWGKIAEENMSVKVWCDATVAFPLIVSQTFAKWVRRKAD
ncbi:MAG: deoxyhypusine synthase [Amphiamblys sp. WSBS2006]|nr:MAG: deoxyhypusine synthase [Amphiamblys sp. WSBS2006]